MTSKMIHCTFVRFASRVYFYNMTETTGSAFLFAYRTR